MRKISRCRGIRMKKSGSNVKKVFRREQDRTCFMESYGESNNTTRYEERPPRETRKTEYTTERIRTKKKSRCKRSSEQKASMMRKWSGNDGKPPELRLDGGV